MDKIDEVDFDEAEEHVGDEPEKLTDEELKEMIKKLDNPVTAQKELAAEIKYHLDIKIKKDMEEYGSLSEPTRRWVLLYNEVLDKLHKNQHGDKSINLHYHKIDHSQVATQMRLAKERQKKKKELNEYR